MPRFVDIVTYREKVSGVEEKTGVEGRHGEFVHAIKYSLADEDKSFVIEWEE